MDRAGTLIDRLHNVLTSVNFIGLVMDIAVVKKNLMHPMEIDMFQGDTQRRKKWNLKFITSTTAITRNVTIEIFD